MFFESREKIVAVLEKLRADAVCTYATNECDCKYGGHSIPNKIGEGTGCPEMRVAIMVLENLTKREWDAVCMRINRRQWQESERAYKDSQRKATP